MARCWQGARWHGLWEGLSQRATLLWTPTRLAVCTHCPREDLLRPFLSQAPRFLSVFWRHQLPSLLMCLQEEKPPHCHWLPGGPARHRLKIQLQALGTGMHKDPFNPAAPSVCVRPKATTSSGDPKGGGDTELSEKFSFFGDLFPPILCWVRSRLEELPDGTQPMTGA